MTEPSRGSALEVLRVFLQLGLTSFGGPVAHLGFFRAELVGRRRWLDEASYSELVALCQFLPGPASSQVGLALGLRRAGWAGALAAWVGFTAPSAVLLILFAYGVQQWAGLATSGVLHGLKVAAVAVVAQAVWGMARALCPDRPRAGVAVVAALLAVVVPGTWGQLLAVGWGAAIGRALLAPSDAPLAAGAGYGVSRRAGAMLLAVFAALLIGLPVLAARGDSPLAQAVSAFYGAGAWVFGGGHVVLPLLQAATVPPGWVGNDLFLAGYGAAQAVPGPLFTFAAYLGAVMQPPGGGWLGGVVMLLALFLPGLLLVLGALPFWESLRHLRAMRRSMAGINAAVVGVLGGALYDPVWTSAVHTRWDFALALAAFGLLVVARVSPVVVVGLAAVAGAFID